MDNNFLQGIGLFLCVGAIVLAAVVFFAFRALTRSRSNVNRDVDREPSVFNTPGTERPRYDTREVESRGGFGGVPQTGSANVYDRDTDRGLTNDRDFDRTVDRSGGLPPLDNDLDQDRDRPRRRDRDDDDDVRSRGGFGG